MSILTILATREKKLIDQETRFLIRAGLFIFLFVAFSIGLFSMYNFVIGNQHVGFATSAVVVVTLIGAWRSWLNIYQPLLISLGIMPISFVAIYFAIQSNGLAGALWIYPTILGIYAVLKERHAWITCIVFSTSISLALWQVEEQTSSARFIISVVATIVYISIFKRQLTTHQSKLELAAVTDTLTGLLNRSWLEKEMAKAESYHKRTGKDVSMLIIDIDKFKYINDTFGHAAGDIVLKRMGHYLKTRFRPTDAIFRVGGEEFIVILYDTNLQQAEAIANTLVDKVQSLSLYESHQVTISVGIACLQDQETTELWMNRADKKLYQAKQEGRNQIAS